MDLIFQPYVGLGSIRFGMTISEIHQLFAQPLDSIIKHPEDPFPMDFSHDLGIYIAYKSPGVCNAVQVTEPATILWQNRSLFTYNYAQIKAWFETIDSSIEVNDSGFTSDQFGIGVYAPGFEEDESVEIEAIIVFEKGYYG